MINNMGKAKLISKNKPDAEQGGITKAQCGRDYTLEIDGKSVPGIISKRIDIKPNEMVTLTIVMQLPVIEYI